MADLKDDLPLSMAIAGLVGISWFIGIEILISLFVTFKHRTGLYFWSILLAAVGVVLQPLTIIIADYGVWTNARGSITILYLTWLIMVVPQSWVLYSRLHLIVRERRLLRIVLMILITNSVIFSVPTIVLGIISQSISPDLFAVNGVWDKVQFIAFFLQETSLCCLYIYKASRYLRNVSAFKASRANTPIDAFRTDRHRILRYLIYTNVGIIILDGLVIGIEAGGYFRLQGALKSAVYGLKLKVEFIVFNLLIKSVKLGRTRAGQLNRTNATYCQEISIRQVSGPHHDLAGPDRRSSSPPASPVADCQPEVNLDAADRGQQMEMQMGKYHSRDRLISSI